MNGRLVLVAAAVLGASACGGGDGPTTPQTGNISGVVTANGTGVQGAQVMLSGGATQTTNASGQFSFSGVVVGSYTLTLTMPEGYELEAGHSLEQPVTVSAGQTTQVNWSLRALPPPMEATVQMQAASFDPADVRVALGGTVKWVNATPTPHTITPNSPSQPGTWESHNVPGEQGHTFSHTFTVAGTYNYNCQFHSGMTGVIRVQ